MAEPAKTLEKCVNNEFNPCFTENAELIYISRAAFLTRQTEKYCIGQTFNKNTNMIELVFFLEPETYNNNNTYIVSERFLHVETYTSPNVWSIQYHDERKRQISQAIGYIGLDLPSVSCTPNVFTFKLLKNADSNTNITPLSALMPASNNSNTNNVSEYGKVCYTENARFITLTSTSYDRETCVGATFQKNTLNIELKFYIAPTDLNESGRTEYQLTAKRYNTANIMNVWFRSDLTIPNIGNICFHGKNSVVSLALIPDLKVRNSKIEIKLSLNFCVQNKCVDEYSEWHKEKMYNRIINNLNIETVNIESNDGGNYTLNKDILTANSEIFEKMFHADMHEANTKTLRIEELNTIQLKSFIKYLLTGDIDCIAEADLVEMLNLAEKYNMPDFKQWIQSRLWNTVNAENCIEMYRIATTFKLTLLERRVEDMLGSEQFLKSEHFKNMQDIDLLRKCFEIKFKCGELY